MAISVKTYEQLVLEDDDDTWELVCGRLRKKPTMTSAHYDVMEFLVRQLNPQLDPDLYAVRSNASRVNISTGSFYVPDVFAAPREWVRRSRASGPGHMEA